MEVLKSSFPPKRFVLYFSEIGGKIWDKISKLFTLPSCGKVSILTLLNDISKFIASRSVKIISFRVNRNAPNKESWNIPTIDLLLAGLIICHGTAAKFFNSDSLSISCGIWRFISSPSKSALYGLVSPTFILKVSPWYKILTIWHIIDNLWRVGWRLNKTPSPSIICLCTLSPFCSLIDSLSIYLREIFSPVFLSKIFAPGYSSGPFLTSFKRNFLLLSFTVTGLVKFLAILRGIPNSLIDSWGSGVITDLAL